MWLSIFLNPIQFLLEKITSKNSNKIFNLLKVAAAEQQVKE